MMLPKKSSEQELRDIAYQAATAHRTQATGQFPWIVKRICDIQRRGDNAKLDRLCRRFLSPLSLNDQECARLAQLFVRVYGGGSGYGL